MFERAEGNTNKESFGQIMIQKEKKSEGDDR